MLDRLQASIPGLCAHRAGYTLMIAYAYTLCLHISDSPYWKRYLLQRVFMLFSRDRECNCIASRANAWQDSCENAYMRKTGASGHTGAQLRRLQLLKASCYYLCWLDRPDLSKQTICKLGQSARVVDWGIRIDDRYLILPCQHYQPHLQPQNVCIHISSH